jgi:hypothetical protein
MQLGNYSQLKIVRPFRKILYNLRRYSELTNKLTICYLFRRNIPHCMHWKGRQIH